jgi:hypothetical protein
MGRRPLASRLLAAAALAVHAFVVGLLLPLHVLGERAPEGTAGAVVTADCGDGNCRVPGHDHGNRGHVHDASHCLLCGASTAPITPPPVAGDFIPLPAPVAAAPSFAAPRISTLRRGPAAARGPPAPAPSV